MSAEHIQILISLSPILASLVITVGVGIYAFNRRSVVGARSFTAATLLEILAIIGYIYELLAPDLAGKAFWDTFQYFGELLVPLAALSFAFEHSGSRFSKSWRFWTAAAAPTILLILLTFFNPGSAAAVNPRLLPRPPFGEYAYGLGPALLLVHTYAYAVIVVAMVIVIRCAIRKKGLYRSQLVVMVLGALLPTLGTLLSFTPIQQFAPQRDLTPYTFALGNLIVSLGIFRYRLFEIVPVARDMLLEKMEDGVIVVDGLGRLVDINQAARAFLHMPGLHAIGQPFDSLPVDWLRRINFYSELTTHHQQIQTGPAERPIYYDLRITHLWNPNCSAPGHLIILRDITHQKQGDTALRQAYEQLEQRVLERTQELSHTIVRLECEIAERQAAEAALRQSEAKFRAIIEQLAEAFLLLDENGTISEVNKAYEHITGLSREQMIGMPAWELQHSRLTPERRTPERLEILKTTIQEALRTGESPLFLRPMDVKIHENGSERYIEQSIFLIQTEQGNRLGSISRDITRQKLAEKALKESYDATLEGWSRALEMRERETAGHCQRVVEMTLQLARRLGVDESQLEHIRRGAILHDIGKLVIPDSILLKPTGLDDDEWAIMRLHPEYALQMLSPIQYLRPALEIPYCHHERWDGSGYPRHLSGEDIPLAARIFAVADVWDALRSDRPYRPAWPEEKTITYIRDLAGKQFDPRVVQAFLEVLTNTE